MGIKDLTADYRYLGEFGIASPAYGQRSLGIDRVLYRHKLTMGLDLLSLFELLCTAVLIG